eukprot:TRINITY_DN15974_c0_g1_i1.p1 TRINITY_DN15974_c0_g1~~TRINITY_DN15974_c0_g1_i1.p1  ORF type:complete len:222 (+),score=20.53 TRINITY_DN15974_c0_g1_i1:53-718(+)
MRIGSFLFVLGFISSEACGVTDGSFDVFATFGNQQEFYKPYHWLSYHDCRTTADRFACPERSDQHRSAPHSVLMKRELYQTLYLNAGGEYSLTCYGLGYTPDIYWRDGENAHMQTAGRGNTIKTTRGTSGNSGTWSQVTSDFTAPSSGLYQIALEFAYPQPTFGYVDDCELSCNSACSTAVPPPSGSSGSAPPYVPQCSSGMTHRTSGRDRGHKKRPGPLV